jgi:gas vesicle protein
MNNNAKVASGILSGALLGASLAILFAPESGKQTRTRITDGTKRLMSVANEGLGKTRKMLGMTEKKMKSSKRAMKA